MYFLDGISIRNLELVPPPASGLADSVDGSLLTRLDTCLTAMGKRTLRHWVVTPLLQTKAIRLLLVLRTGSYPPDSNEYEQKILLLILNYSSQASKRGREEKKKLLETIQRLL